MNSSVGSFFEPFETFVYIACLLALLMFLSKNTRDFLQCNSPTTKRLLAVKYETAGQCKKHCCRETRLFLGHAQNGKHRILTKFHGKQKMFRKI